MSCSEPLIPFWKNWVLGETGLNNGVGDSRRCWKATTTSNTRKGWNNSADFWAIRQIDPKIAQQLIASGGASLEMPWKSLPSRQRSSMTHPNYLRQKI